MATVMAERGYDPCRSVWTTSISQRARLTTARTTPDTSTEG